MGLNHAIDRLPVRQRVDFANIVQRNRQECPADIYIKGIQYSPPKDTPHHKGAVFCWISNNFTSSIMAFLKTTNFY